MVLKLRRDSSSLKRQAVWRPTIQDQTSGGRLRFTSDRNRVYSGITLLREHLKVIVGTPIGRMDISLGQGKIGALAPPRET